MSQKGTYHPSVNLRTDHLVGSGTYLFSSDLCTRGQGIYGHKRSDRVGLDVGLEGGCSDVVRNEVGMERWYGTMLDCKTTPNSKKEAEGSDLSSMRYEE